MENNNEVVFSIDGCLTTLLLIFNIFVIIIILGQAFTLPIAWPVSFGLIFSPFTFLLIYVKNKKIIFKDGIFYVTNWRKKKYEIRYEDIEKIIHKPQTAIVLYTINKEKVIVDVAMSNYDWLVQKLQKDGIPFFNKKGQKINMGW